MKKTNDQLPQDFSDSELAEAYDNLRYQEQELASAKKVLGEELLSRLKNDGGIMGNYTITRVKKYSVGVDKKDKPKALEKFRLLGAVKTKEDFDMNIIKGLYFKNIDLPYPVVISESVLVKLIKESDE